MAVPAQPRPRRSAAGGGRRGATNGRARRPASSWSNLDAAGKRSRLLEVAEGVFARDGLEAPVPAIAAAAGIGVGSVYRAFASKDEIVAALASHRLRWLHERAVEALADPDPWGSVERLLRSVAERQQADGVLGEALAAALRGPELAQQLATATAVVDAVLARARETGALRFPVSTDELRALFTALRAADAAQPSAGATLLELVLAGLRAEPATT
jgi:AcrR family transcriptional regulator